MKVRLLSFVVALAALALYGRLVSAEPSGSGLAYDEVVKFVGAASPPPPGSFKADYGAIVNGSAQSAAAPAPQRHRMSFGNIASQILGGRGAADAVAGDAAETAAQNGMEGALSRTLGGMLNGFSSLLRGHAERRSFYNGWERVDDPVEQTATITKCDRHEVIKLDLAKKTYSVTDTNAHSEAAAATGTAPRRSSERTAPAHPAQPGTMKLELARTGSALGGKTIDAVPTSGYASTFAMTASDATGSCRNGRFSVTHTEYVSAYDEPRAYCPLARVEHVNYPTQPTDFVTGPPSGGCKPAITARNSGPSEPSGRLPLYSLMTMAGHGDSAATGGGFSFLIERGNLKQLGAADANLFEVPAGFKKTSS
jgi:hypothetical protein